MTQQPTREAFARPAGAGDPCNPKIEAAPESAGALAVVPGESTALADYDDTGDSLTPYIDANGFDPADYKWVPVRRRPRADGWSEAKQRAFIEVLADTGVVDEAADHVGMSVQSCYRLRRAPGAEAFAAAWNAAIQQAALRLVDLAFDRAINGSDEPVFNRDGRRVGRRLKPSDRMLMFLMRAHMPERYRHAHQSVRMPGEAPPPPVVPLAEAIAVLEPALPADPHLLMPADDLDVEVQVADMMEGELPRWYRHTQEQVPAEPSLGEDFERELDAIKQENSRKAGYVPPDEDGENTAFA